MTGPLCRRDGRKEAAKGHGRGRRRGVRGCIEEGTGGAAGRVVGEGPGGATGGHRRRRGPRMLWAAEEGTVCRESLSQAPRHGVVAEARRGHAHGWQRRALVGARGTGATAGSAGQLPGGPPLQRSCQARRGYFLLPACLEGAPRTPAMRPRMPTRRARTRRARPRRARRLGKKKLNNQIDYWREADATTRPRTDRVPCCGVVWTWTPARAGTG